MTDRSITWTRHQGYEDITYETSGDGIAKITIDRPEVRNAFRPLTTKEMISAFDLALKYHDRWEIELALDELKTHQAGVAQGTLVLAAGPEHDEREAEPHCVVRFHGAHAATPDGTPPRAHLRP